MATVFTTYFGENYYPTSSIDTVRATTDKDRVSVEIFCENGVGGDIETFYTTTLYAFNGVVELSDVGSLIEEYFRLRGKVVDTITITFDEATLDGIFLYCEYGTDIDFDPDNMLFVAATAQRVHQDSTVVMASYDHGSDSPFTIKAVGHRASDGTLAVVTKKKYNNLYNNSCWFGIYSIVRWALNLTSEEAGEDLSDVLYFSIEYGGLQKLCYIVPAAAYLTFEFNNIFNVQEFIDIVGTMTTKTEVSRDTAVCGGKSVQYDRNVTRTFQVETEPVPSEEIPMFEQFLTSHTIYLNLSGEEYPVIITDHTSEPSNDDGSLTTFKFSWRFADRRPMIFNTLVNGIIPVRRNVFTDTFSPEYD